MRRYGARFSSIVISARELNDRLLPLHRDLFIEANPIPVKWAVQQLGRIGPALRLPLTPLSTNCHDRVRAAMRAAGISL